MVNFFVGCKELEEDRNRVLIEKKRGINYVDTVGRVLFIIEEGDLEKLKMMLQRMERFKLKRENRISNVRERERRGVKDAKKNEVVEEDEQVEEEDVEENT